MGLWDGFDAVTRVDAGTRALLEASGLIVDGARAYERARYGDILPTLLLPDDVVAHADQVQIAYDLFDRDVESSDIFQRDKAFYASWKTFLGEWHVFYATKTAWFQHIPIVGDLANSPRAIDDQIKWYSDELAKWKTELERRLKLPIGGPGGPISTPPLDTTAGPKPDGIGDKLEKWLTIFAAIAAITALGYTIHETKK